MGFETTSSLIKVKQPDGSYTTVHPTTTLKNVIGLEERLKMLEDMIGALTGGINPFSVLYPIGSVYISLSSLNPQELFGFGTWEQINDVFLLASGSSFPPNTTGGEANHTLTVSEIPSHNHTFTRHMLHNNDPGIDTGDNAYGVTNKTIDLYLGETDNTGGGLAHNNMPPYMTVYMWTRVS